MGDYMLSPPEPDPRRDHFLDKDAEEVALRWGHDKQIQLVVGGEVERQSPGLYDILEELTVWVSQYLAGETDTWPNVTEDCTGEGLDDVVEPWEFSDKLCALAALHYDAKECAWEDSPFNEREGRRAEHV